MELPCVKRLRMEISLAGRDLSVSPPPRGYSFLPWESSLLEAFAQAKHRSFRNSFDINLFPCLGNVEGCRRLMSEIAAKPGFLSEATWLLVHAGDGGGRPEFCGTVQGVCDEFGLGAIQNLGVAGEHRSQGLGAALLRRALAGFRRAGITRVYLEVTADNHHALRLYRKTGFSTVRAVYKTLESSNSSRTTTHHAQAVYSS
jgi:GNAT superfamily N-acetyltransferase